MSNLHVCIMNTSCCLGRPLFRDQCVKCFNTHILRTGTLSVRMGWNVNSGVTQQIVPRGVKVSAVFHGECFTSILHI